VVPEPVVAGPPSVVGGVLREHALYSGLPDEGVGPVAKLAQRARGVVFSALGVLFEAELPPVAVLARVVEIEWLAVAKIGLLLCSRGWRFRDSVCRVFGRVVECRVVGVVWVGQWVRKIELVLQS